MTSPLACRNVSSSKNSNVRLTRKSSALAHANHRRVTGFKRNNQGGGAPTTAHTGSGDAPHRLAAFSLESLGQGTSYGTGGRDDNGPSEVVGVLEEIEEIPHMPRLAEVVPFVAEAYRAGLVAPEQEN